MNNFGLKYKYDNMKGWFAYELYKQMKKNKNVWVIVGDLGYKMFDYIKRDFPDRFINVGASEQAMTGIAIGLALEGKIPISYSITPFVLYRPFEAIRNYIDYERIPVKLIGAGRNKDYFDHGLCHWAEEDRKIMNIFKNIKSIWPNELREIPGIVEKMIKSDKPWYVNLKR